MNELRQKIEGWQIKADALICEDRRAFIIDSNNTYFFCDLLINGKTRLLFIPFKGNNSGEKIERYWADIIKFEEYIDKEGDLNGRI
jgi:hypothetical protein